MEAGLGYNFLFVVSHETVRRIKMPSWIPAVSADSVSDGCVPVI